jgi:hypothetical protein
MRPSVFTIGERIDVERTLEDIFVDDALSIDVIRDGFTLGSIPNTEFSNVEPGRV